MRRIVPREFTGARAWEALGIEHFTGPTTVRLHWTDQPYRWHVNDGPDVFVVLDGVVVMHVREAGAERALRLTAGDIFHACRGDEHVAHPQGPARILVIECEGSV